MFLGIIYILLKSLLDCGFLDVRIPWTVCICAFVFSLRMDSCILCFFHFCPSLGGRVDRKEVEAQKTPIDFWWAEAHQIRLAKNVKTQTSFCQCIWVLNFVNGSRSKFHLKPYRGQCWWVFSPIWYKRKLQTMATTPLSSCFYILCLHNTELKWLTVYILAFLVKIVLFLPSVPQSHHCPEAALSDTHDHVESHEHIVAKSIL